MNISFIATASLLTLIAVLLIVLPIWKHRHNEGRTVASLSIVALLICVPLAVVFLYSTVSSFPWDDSAIEQGAAQPADNMEQPVNELVRELAARLQQEPTVEGYAMLGKSYMQLERYNDAVSAWHEAWTISRGEAPAISLGYAEALILSDRRTLTTSAADLVDRVLKQQPDDPRALWYGGLSSAARGNNSEAASRWGTLLGNPALPEPLRKTVQQQMAALGGPAQASAAPDESTNDTAIEVTIELSEAVAAQAGEGGTLFVIAREAGRPGPPVAVSRIRNPTFPLTTQLTSANVMIQGNSLGAIEQLEVTARLSSTGEPIEQPGDLYGTTQDAAEISPDHKVSVIIDKISSD